MDEQAVHGLERDLRQVLVRTVDRVAGLEADDALPAAFGEDRACLDGVARQLLELRARPLEDGDEPGEVERILRVEPRHPRMRLVSRAEAALGLARPVVLVDV